MARSLKQGDHAAEAKWADISIGLLKGSGASFVLAGDFSVDDYQVHIRPSMMPPAAPLCLSGLMSVDHRVLVQKLRDLRPSLRALHDRDPVRHATILAELARVYDLHIHVCEKFVGNRPSLLTAGQTEKSGPQLIEQFKNLRLKPLQTTAHVRPLCPSTSPPTVA